MPKIPDRVTELSEEIKRLSSERQQAIRKFGYVSTEAEVQILKNLSC